MTAQNDITTQIKFLPYSLGFAIFAMFFGAGNLIFPLDIGVHAGYDVAAAIIGFVISGVIVPFLGLYVISLYHGNYMEFLANLGRVPSLIVAAVLIFLLGIFVATPRTGLLSFNTLYTFFPEIGPHRLLFNTSFFALVYLISLQQMRIIDALGWVLSPLKLLVLLTLIVFGIGIRHRVAPPIGGLTNAIVFAHAIKLGYATMDLLAGFFFCSFVHKSICHKLDKQSTPVTPGQETRITLIACIVGAALLGIIYSLFILVANFHSAPLQGIPTHKLIGHLAMLLLHQYGGIFLSICVVLACFSTAIALTAIAVEFIQVHTLKGRVNYHIILPTTLIVIFTISNLGFVHIMTIAIPILGILYPPLLGLTIGNILYKIKGWNIGPWLFYTILIITILLSLIYR
ncbi:MAG: hypothetical protein GY782_12625 [Gammaproteobacteria bacterium]|nr:hypothetical protein [Gammaproteobacteria bacterium]